MIRNRLLVLMAQKGTRRLKDVSEATGISPNALGRMADQRTTRFDAPVLGALCAYFGCQPGDLLEYVPDAQPDEDEDEDEADARPGEADPPQGASAPRA
jgi:putative transcriptional regulator